MLVPYPELSSTILARHQSHKTLTLRKSPRDDLDAIPIAAKNVDPIDNRNIKQNNVATSLENPIENIENQCAPLQQDTNSAENRLVSKLSHKVNLAGDNTKRKKVLSLSLNRENIARPTQANKKNSVDSRHSPLKKRLKTWEMHEYMQHQTGASSSNDYILPKASHNSDESSYKQRKQITSSMATLCNIGNTCYLNSVVYTLRFAPRFLHNLHHVCDDLSEITQKVHNKGKSASLGRNVGGIQGSNTRSWSTKDLASIGSFVDVPRTNRQIATEKLHELYTHLYRNEVVESTEAFHADTFLNAVQDVSSIFEGNQQQDAHEFLMCVLDSIRETCNSLTKVITECPDIVANGYVSLPEKIEVQTSQSKNIVQNLFRKLSKDDKSKTNRSYAPSKENNANRDANNQKSGSITNFDDELMCGPDKEKNVEKVNEKIKQMGLDFFTEDFEGVTCSSTKCLSCETITEQKETMIDLSVPITGYENIDQQEDPNLFIQNLCITREQFRGENKYRCEVCTGLTEAIRTVSYPVLPRLLIIQLKRFSGGMEKINNYIPTPFNLQCFCSECYLLSEAEKKHIYRLYSVITHVGATLSVGHYIAYTTSLDNYKDYYDCPKDKRKNHQNPPCPVPPVGGQNAEKSLVKKYIFGKSKATSGGDVTRNIKNLNGSVKNLTNGIDKTASNGSTSCQSVSCCGILMKNSPGTSLSSLNINGISEHLRHNSYVDNLSNSSLNDDCGSYGGSNFSKKSEPLWFMCDDDKINTMTQREFEDRLSPDNKIMVTPYLLFYARVDLR